MSAPVLVFISYAHEDAEHKDALERQLSFTKWSSDPDLVTWIDDQIRPGSEWQAQIRDKLENAGLVIFLLSAKLLASEYVREVEVPIAFERRAQGRCEILTVVLREVVLDGTPFEPLQHVLADAVEHYPHSDDAWAQVARAIIEKVNGIQRPRVAEDEPAAEDAAGSPAEPLATVLAFPPKLDMLALREALATADLSASSSWASLAVRLSPLLRMLLAASRDEALSAYQRGQCDQLHDALLPLTRRGSGGRERLGLLQYAERRRSLALAALDQDR